MTQISRPKILVYSVIEPDSSTNDISEGGAMKDLDSIIQSIISQYPQHTTVDGSVLSMRLRASEIEFVIERRPCECGPSNTNEPD